MTPGFLIKLEQRLNRDLITVEAGTAPFTTKIERDVPILKQFRRNGLQQSSSNTAYKTMETESGDEMITESGNQMVTE